MEEENKEIKKQLEEANIEPIEGDAKNNGNKPKYSTINYDLTQNSAYCYIQHVLE